MDFVAYTERLPKPGETVSGSRFATAPGGKGANQALAVRRAGADVRLIGAVGEDDFAGHALQLLQEAGVDLSGVRACDSPTGTALILIGSDGENMIAVVPGANGTLTPTDTGRFAEKLSADDVLLLQCEIPIDAIEQALCDAKRKGALSILNIAPFVPGISSLSTLADIVIANETEFDALCKQSNLPAADRETQIRHLHDETGQVVVVTLGAEGVMAAYGGSVVRAEGLTIEPLDTVGAGDTFCGYLAAGLDQRLDFNAALYRAAVAGSLACLKEGAQPSIPTSADVAKSSRKR